jgi:hypothetical protein
MCKLEHAVVRVSGKDVKSHKSLAPRMFLEKLVPAQVSATLVVSRFFQRWAIFSHQRSERITSPCERTVKTLLLECMVIESSDRPSQ